MESQDSKAKDLHCIIREITLDDYKAYLDLRNLIDAESEFMLYEFGERLLTYDQQKNIIRNVLFRPNQAIFVVEDEGKLVGFLEAQGGTVRKILHKVFIVIGLLTEYRGKGLGTKLFERLEVWAREKGIHRLELIFMDGNEPGRHLYEKMGFIEEARLKDMYFIKGKYVDEIRMCKILH